MMNAYAILPSSFPLAKQGLSFAANIVEPSYDVVMSQYQPIAELLDSPFRLAALESPEPSRVVNIFRQMNAASGKAVYDWVPNSGLYRIGAEQIYIPRTATPADLLEYITSSRHYGIYLLREFDVMLGDATNLNRLQKAINVAGNVHRLVVLLGVTVHLPTVLRSAAARIQHTMRKREPLGLS
jgi:hypothetical protein